VGTDRSAERLVAAIERHGILLVHDASLPSATAVVAGAPVAGSWWAHELAHVIYDALQEADRDALRVKLVGGKVTFVHRRLWPELVAVGRAGARWQHRDLAPPATALLEAVRRRRRPARAGDVGLRGPAAGAAVKALEVRLLVRSEEVHTEQGSHVRELETWAGFASRRGLGALPPAAEARARLEAIVSSWGPRADPAALVPWLRPSLPTGAAPARRAQGAAGG
jgi:hypothetical protein